MNCLVNRLLSVFVNICLLRAAPQDLPVSGFLLMLTAGLSLVSGTLVLQDSFGGLFQGFLAQLLDLALLAILLQLVLVFKHKPERFAQTCTALFGTGVLLNLATIPTILMMSDDPSASPPGELAMLLYLLLMLWVLVVIAHILRHTLEIRLGNGFVLAVGYFFLVNWLAQLLFEIG